MSAPTVLPQWSRPVAGAETDASRRYGPILGWPQWSRPVAGAETLLGPDGNPGVLLAAMEPPRRRGGDRSGNPVPLTCLETKTCERCVRYDGSGMQMKLSKSITNLLARGRAVVLREYAIAPLVPSLR
jgi:hypothetical protein